CHSDVAQNTSDIAALGGGEQTRYYSINVGDFSPYSQTSLWALGNACLRADSATVQQLWIGGVHLPQGATVTELTIGWYRDDALAMGEVYLQRMAIATGTAYSMASIATNSVAGNHLVTDSSILEPVIDNTIYSYHIYLSIDPNNSIVDVKFYGGVITYTITEPLP
ncbi:unnamed protein product, partial [marine sediment metagenome]